MSLRTLFRSLAHSQARDYRGQLSAAAWAHSVDTSGKGYGTSLPTSKMDGAAVIAAYHDLAIWREPGLTKMSPG